MKRALLVIGLVLGVTAFVFVSLGAGDDDDAYLVRAVFDNGAYVVNDEDVRVAGANVGSVRSVDVAMPGEIVSYEDGEPKESPGKAIIVLEIIDPGFHDFREDASCMIRAQSLIGEKYIDCRPTLPRAPGTPAPPPLERIEDGPGEGQYLLPVENNGKAVDIDLLNNIMRKPYAERFRLLFNNLGAGFAARGEDLAEIIRRANPTLRDTDRVLAVLAAQRKQLAQLAADSAEILEPLARERESFAGFISNAGTAAEVTAEHGAEVEASFERFPRFLDELRSTMASLQGFSEATEPVVADFNRAADDLTTVTKRFQPFLGNSTRALRSLGDAGDLAGPDLAAVNPLVQRVRKLGRTGQRPLKNAAALLGSVRKRKGFEYLMDLIYNTGASMNGFDNYGHYLRAVATPSACVVYDTNRVGGECDATFLPGAFAASASSGPRDPVGDNAGSGGAGARVGDAAIQAQGLLDYLLNP